MRATRLQSPLNSHASTSRQAFILYAVCTLSIFFCSSFVWFPLTGKAYFLVAILCLFYLGQNRRALSSMGVAQLGIPLVAISTVSCLSGVLAAGMPLVLSWHIQLVLHAAIFLVVEALVRHGYEDFQTVCLLFVKYGCIPLIVVALYMYRGWIPEILFSTEISHPRSYYLVALMNQSFGLQKQTFPWFASCLGLIALPRMRNWERFIIAGVLLFFVWVVRTKTVMLGLFAVAFFYLLSKQPHRLLWCFVYIAAGIAGVIICFDLVNATLIEQGRYVFPVLCSPDFWKVPAGTGMGNYTTAVLSGVYGDNSFVEFVNERMMQALDVPVWNHELYPVPESDLLVVAVAFGWLGGGLILLKLAHVALSAIAGYDDLAQSQKSGLFLLVFLVGASITQDWLLGPAGWFFYSFALCAVLYGGPSSRQCIARGSPTAMKSRTKHQRQPSGWQGREGTRRC